MHALLQKHIKELESEIATLKDRFMFLSSQSKSGTLSFTKK
jgi:ribosomal protein L29